MLPEWALYTLGAGTTILCIFLLVMAKDIREWVSDWRFHRGYYFWVNEGKRYSSENQEMRSIIGGLIGDKQAETYGYPWIDDFGACVYCHARLGFHDYDEPSEIQHEIDCPFERALQFMEAR